VPKFHWVYEYGERIKVYNNEEDDPTFSTPKPTASSGVDDNDKMDIFGGIMRNPFNTEFNDTYDSHDENDDYQREPSPLDPGQENAMKALILAAENGDNSAWQRIELALKGAHGKKRGKSCNGKPAQSDFETALLRLWRSSTNEQRQCKNDARRHVRQARREKDYAEADRSRRELAAAEKSKAEELRWKVEAHVCEVEQHEREASQSHQSAPTASSVPPPPPPPPMPMPHHPPAASGSAQHPPSASATGPASLPLRPPPPAPRLPGVNTPPPVAPVWHPRSTLESSDHPSAAHPPEPCPVPMSREPPRAPWGMLIPPRGHWEPPRVQEQQSDPCAPLWVHRSQ
jgi:hypothetical protein